MVYYEEFNHSYLYCMDADLGWGNRSYFTYFSQFNRGAYSSLLGAVESAVLMLLFFLSMLSNMIIFYMLSSDRSLRTVTSYFMCNLTLADVCFTLCCPLIAVVRATERWTLGSVACKTAAYLSIVCGFVAIWTLTLISIDRYMCIVRSTKRRITPTAALVLIAAVWVISLVAFSPLLIYFVVKDCPHGADVVSICTLGFPRTPGVSVPVIFTAILIVFGFVIPTGVLVVSHVSIFIKVHKVQVALIHVRHRRSSTSSTTQANVLTAPTTASDSLVAPQLLEARRQSCSRNMQVMKTLVYLVLLFLVLWAPLFIVFVLIMLDAHHDVMQLSSQAFVATLCLAYCNAVLNPLAYGLSTERFRASLLAFFTCSGRLTGSASLGRIAADGVSHGIGGGVSAVKVRGRRRRGGRQALLHSRGCRSLVKTASVGTSVS